MIKYKAKNSLKSPRFAGVKTFMRMEHVVTTDDIDFAVVPCLSFDRRGRRLGQGGGYYDRLLPQLSCPTCLICRERLMSEAVPTEEHDRRCTLYVTERGVMEPET